MASLGHTSVDSIALDFLLQRSARWFPDSSGPWSHLQATFWASWEPPPSSDSEGLGLGP